MRRQLARTMTFGLVVALSGLLASIQAQVTVTYIDVFPDAGTPLELSRSGIDLVLRRAAPTATRTVYSEETRLAAGRFLVAKREMIDPNFAKTVVLLLDYGTHGSLGLVINRPSEMRVSALLPEMDELKQRKDMVWVGGPVPGNNMFLLVRSTEEPDQSRLIFEDVYVSRSEELLARLAKKRKSRFRVYAGYAGWAPGQLDHEVARGDWHIVQADGDVVFAEDPDEIWGILIPPVPSQQARLRLDNFNKSATSPPLLGYYESRR